MDMTTTMTTRVNRTQRLQKAGHDPGQIPQAAQVKDYMTTSISVVSPETRLSEALHLFRTMNLNVLAVYEGKRYVGLIERGTLEERTDHDSRSVRVREIMDTAGRPCSLHDSLLEVCHRMRQTAHTFLPVLDQDGKAAGVLSVDAGEAFGSTVEFTPHS
jgi:CBS domain-containing protein